MQQLPNQIEQLLKHLNDEQEAGAMPQDDQSIDEEPEEIIDVYFVRREPEITVVDATPPQNTKNTSSIFTYAILFFAFFLPLSAIFFQLYLLYNPPIATVTIIPTVQTFSLKSTIQLGRMVHPITLSQSQTVATTGKGHRNATRATGTITFYNGQLISITVSAGTILTGADSVQVTTDQDATIPAADLTANPPLIGNATVSAHAVNPGASGNIQALDINIACCSSVVAKNSSFSGGQDARDFQMVAKADITNVSTSLKTLLSASTKGALQGQLQPGEELQTLPCSPIVATDHQPGDEATKVTVTVSETCNAAAYNKDELQRKATQLLTSQALRRLGAGYSLLGDIQVTPTSIEPNREQKRVVVSLHAHATFVHTFTAQEQAHIKRLIHGKTKQQAVQLLATVPGIETASIISSGFGDETRLPTDPRNIHVVVLYGIDQYHRFS
jgi:hypothetical protein